MGLDKDIEQIKKLFEGKPIFKPATSQQRLRRPTPNWSSYKKNEIEEEFYRLAYDLHRQGDIEILIDLIPFKSKKDFVVQYHAEDYLDQ